MVSTFHKAGNRSLQRLALDHRAGDEFQRGDDLFMETTLPLHRKHRRCLPPFTPWGKPAVLQLHLLTTLNE
ncbi:MAG: hypothetical protein ACPHGV_10500 [Synechococcus sp.]